MKRMIAILMAAMMLTGVLTACSGTVGMGDGRAYGNVSTTPDGRVNGRGYDDGNYGTGYAARNGMNGSVNGGYYGGTVGNAFGANGNSGTGMTGGR